MSTPDRCITCGQKIYSQFFDYHLIHNQSKEISLLRDQLATKDVTLGEMTALARKSEADLAAARADAERYRWLRSTNAFALLAIAWSHPAAQAIGEDCDGTIDAALASGEGKP